MTELPAGFGGQTSMLWEAGPSTGNWTRPSAPEGDVLRDINLDLSLAAGTGRAIYIRGVAMRFISREEQPDGSVEYNGIFAAGTLNAQYGPTFGDTGYGTGTEIYVSSHSLAGTVFTLIMRP